jgi:hypothetical protein
MTGLILMLAVAGAMALFREPLGRGLVRLVEAMPWRRLAVLAVVLFLMWVSLQTFHVGFVAPLTGDTLGPLFDLAFGYADLVIAVAVAVLNRQTRLLLGRLIDLAGLTVRKITPTGRARRAPARPRRRLPDRDEPEPGVFDPLVAFA